MMTNTVLHKKDYKHSVSDGTYTQNMIKQTLCYIEEKYLVYLATKCVYSKCIVDIQISRDMWIFNIDINSFQSDIFPQNLNKTYE